MKILVIGRTGLIESELCQLFARKQIPFMSCLINFGIDTPQNFESILDKNNPSLVVSVGWWDDLSQNHTEYFQEKEKLVSIIARVCKKKKIILLYVSSCRVFSGENNKPYKETDCVNASDAIGNALQKIEHEIREKCSQHIILRISWIIHYRKNNKLATFLDKIKQGQTLDAKDTFYGNPTAVSDIARVILGVVLQVHCGASAWGTYHYGSSGIVSEKYFAEAIRLELLNIMPEKIWKTIYSQSKHDSKNGGYYCLDSSLIRDTFGIQQSDWRDSLSLLVQTRINTLIMTE